MAYCLLYIDHDLLDFFMSMHIQATLVRLSGLYINFKKRKGYEVCSVCLGEVGGKDRDIYAQSTWHTSVILLTKN